MKIASNTSFQILLTFAFSMSLKGLILSMLHMIGFNAVLGGVMGTVCSVVFGVLATLLISHEM